MTWKLDRIEGLDDKLRKRYLAIPRVEPEVLLRALGVGLRDLAPQHPPESPEGGGAVYHPEGMILYGAASRFGGPVLEIGADRGVSTRYILAGLQPAHKVYSVDVRHLWRPRLAEDPHGQRVAIETNSRELMATEIPVVRWAFIDGDHTYDGVDNDTGQAVRLGAGFMIYHDCSPWQPRARRVEPSTHTGSTEGSDAFEAVTDRFWDDPAWVLTYVCTQAGLLIASKGKLL